MKRTSYATDLTDAQWRRIAPWVPKPKPGGRPVAYERREIVNADKSKGSGPILFGTRGAESFVCKFGFEAELVAARRVCRISAELGDWRRAV